MRITAFDRIARLIRAAPLTVLCVTVAISVSAGFALGEWRANATAHASARAASDGGAVLEFMKRDAARTRAQENFRAGN